jgi:hypothetical protein
MNKLGDWINAEEAQGYSEEQLSKSLLKRGYQKEEINKAILYLKQKFHIKALLHIPIYLIITFFVSLLFLGWAFGEFIQSLILSGILIGSIFVMDFFDKKNMDLLSWTFLITLYIIFLFVSPLFFMLAMSSLILALIVFFKKKRQINLYLINMSLLVSIFITALIGFLIYLFIVYIIIQNLPNTNMIYLSLFFLPIVFVIPPLIYYLNHLALSKIKAE